MTTIRETITSAVFLPIEANDYLPRVVDALTEREYTFTDLVAREVSFNFGVSEADVKEHIAAAGYAVRPEPEPVAPTVEELAEALGHDLPKAEKKGKKTKGAKALKQRLARLEKLAEEHGLLRR